MTGEADVISENAELEEKEHDDFEAAFNEEAEKREAPPEDDEPDDIASIEDTPPGHVNAADTPAATDEDPAPAADDGFKGWNPEAVETFNKETEGWPEGAVDSYKTKINENNQLNHRINSDNGRVSAFQRKINNLEHEIATIQKGPGEQPSNEEITDAMATDEGWNQFKEDYPEVAEAIDARLDNALGEVNTKIAPVVEKAQQDRATEAEAAQEEAYGEVAKEFPTWQTAVQEDVFQNWMATQPPGVQALAASDDPRDASTLIGKYDDHRVASNLPSLKADHVPDDTVVDNTDEVDEVAQRRERQLEDGTTLPSQKTRIDVNAEPTDGFEAAFNAFAAKKVRDKQQA